MFAPSLAPRLALSVFALVFMVGSTHAAGVTPPYVSNGWLLPGSTYVQQIIAVNSVVNYDVWVHPVKSAGVPGDWITYDPPPPFKIPAGQNTAPFRAIVNVPPDAAPGDYTGRITLRFNTDPNLVWGGGAVINVNLTVVTDPVYSLRVTRYFGLPDTVGRLPIRTCFDVFNEGNTPDNYSRVELAVRTYGGAPVGTFSADILTTVPPFTRQQVCADVPNTLSPGSSTPYIANLRLYRGEVLATSADLGLQIFANPNPAPIARPGSSRTVQAGPGNVAVVTLDGSTSSDPNGSLTAWTWLYQGATIANTPTTSVTLDPGVHTFTLRVTDNSNESASASVTITVTPNNNAPTARAGDDVSVTEGYDGFATIMLDGSASSDPDGDSLSFTWSLDGELVTTEATTVLELPPGRYVATLLVNDGRGGAGYDDVAIEVLALPPNNPPTADAGPDQSFVVEEGELAEVTLDGSGSSDPDSTPGDSDLVAFVWTLDGEVVSTDPTFAVALPAGQHVLALSVLDRRGGSDIDEVLVDIVAIPKNRPPVAAATAPAQSAAGAGCRANVTLDGRASSDPDFAVPQRSERLTFRWYSGSQLLGEGETLTVSRPLGAHSARLVVTDHQGLSAEASTSFTVADTTPPTVSMTLGLTSLWPADQQLYDVGLGFAASDNCDPTPTVLVSVTSDEAASSAPPGRGPRVAARPDAVLDEDGTLWLRAERLGSGDGRVYRIGVTARDDAGLSAATSGSVGVAQRPNRPAIDSGIATALTSREFTVEAPEPELPLVWVIAGEPRVTSYDQGQATIVWDALRDATSYRVWQHGDGFTRTLVQDGPTRSFTAAIGTWWRIEAIDATGATVDFINLRAGEPAFVQPSGWVGGRFSDDFEDGVLNAAWVNPKPYQVSESNGVLRLTQTHTDDRSGFFLPYDTEGRRYLRIAARIFQHRSGDMPFSGGIQLFAWENAWKWMSFYSPWEWYMQLYGADVRAIDYRADTPNEDYLIQVSLDDVARFDRWYDYELVIDTHTGEVSGALDGQAIPAGTNTHFMPGGRVIIHLQPYGWFTGHYMLFDDVVVESWN